MSPDCRSHDVIDHWRSTYVLNKSTLVLEGVTLAQVVELVVEVLVDLAGSAVLDEQAAEDTQTTHPHNLTVIQHISTLSLEHSLGPLSPCCHPKPCISLRLPPLSAALSWCFGANLRWHSSIGGTLPLTETTVTSNAAGGGQLPGAGTRVHSDGLLDNEAIGDELADGLAGVGVGDLVDLIWVEPDLALAAVGDAGGQALLGAEIDPTGAIVSAIQYSGGLTGRGRRRCAVRSLRSRPGALRAAV